RQCSFHHVMQVLRVRRFSTFSLPPAFPLCYFPLCLSTSGRVADLWDIPSIPILLCRDTVLTVTAHVEFEAVVECAEHIGWLILQTGNEHAKHRRELLELLGLVLLDD